MRMLVAYLSSPTTWKLKNARTMPQSQESARGFWPQGLWWVLNGEVLKSVYGRDPLLQKEAL